MKSSIYRSNYYIGLVSDREVGAFLFTENATVYRVPHCKYLFMLIYNSNECINRLATGCIIFPRKQ